MRQLSARRSSSTHFWTYSKTVISRCQRCDGDLRRPAGAEEDWQAADHDNQLQGHFSYMGAYGSLRYDYELWKAELCESCCEDLRRWIDNGKGEGVFVVDTLEVAEKASGGNVMPSPGTKGYRGFIKKYREMLRKHGIRRPY